MRQLPIKTADEWNEFQTFYDSDQEILNYVKNNPKAFAVSLRYNIQTMRDCGRFADSISTGVLCLRAIEQMFWDSQEREEKEFVKSKGYNSWAEYMAENGTGEDVRESWKKVVEKEKGHS